MMIQHVLACAAVMAAMAMAVAAARGAEENMPGKLVPLGEGWARTMVNAVIFRRDAVTTFKDTQYAAWYDAESRVMLAKRRLGTDAWEVRRTELTGNTKDAHNSISIAVDGAGYLHLSWDHHVHPLRYVRSKAPGSLELTDKLPMTGRDETRVTYPEFFSLPDGGLLFLYRVGGSGNGDTLLNRYDVKTGEWSAVQHPLIIGQGERNAYTNGIAIGPDGTWHISWCWRETPDAATNHDICYARSRDQGRTWEKSTGEAYRLPITAETAEYVQRIPEGSTLLNHCTMATDSRGRPLIAMYWKAEAAAHVQYYVLRLTDGRWEISQASRRAQDFEMPKGSGTRRMFLGRPAIAVDDKDRVILIIRDVERGERASALVSDDADLKTWRTVDLTTEPLGAWEPSYDRALWARDRVLHIFVQRVGQASGEKMEDLPPQKAYILEWKP